MSSFKNKTGGTSHNICSLSEVGIIKYVISDNGIIMEFSLELNFH